MEKIRVILISSVRPEPTSGGEIILHRHLVNQPWIELEVYGQEPTKLTPTSLIRRLAGRLGQTRWRKFAEDFWIFWAGRWMDPMLPSEVASRRRTVVMTVAHGDGFMAAMRFARGHRLPLVSFFQDWWPDMAEAHGFARRILEKHFCSLADQSSVGVCVSEGMKNLLGNERSVVLPPIPAAAERQTASPAPRTGKFRLLYFGNLVEYGPMLGKAIEALEGNAHVELVVRGTRPKWPPDFAAEMKRQGKWLDFAPRGELEAWLESADAFLVPMVFDPAMHRRMETSFPSKLIEFAQFGKPLVVWGPDYCSAVEWARRSGGALCVTDASAAALVGALQNLATSHALRASLATAISSLAAGEFRPTEIQKRFRSLLERVVSEEGSNERQFDNLAQI